MNTINATSTPMAVRTGSRNEKSNGAEICIGAMMAVAAVSGIWFVVSLLISLITAA